MRTLRATVGPTFSTTSRTAPLLRSGWMSTITYGSFCSR